MGIVKCKDCIYGDCFGGKNRSCVNFPSIGTIYTVSDDFFCVTKGKSKKEFNRPVQQQMGVNKGGEKMNYNEMYEECLDEWKKVETRFQIIGNLKCKSIRFFSDTRRKQGKNSLLTFFIVNGTIIGAAQEYCEGVNIFGNDI